MSSPARSATCAGASAPNTMPTCGRFAAGFKPNDHPLGRTGLLAASTILQRFHVAMRRDQSTRDRTVERLMYSPIVIASDYELFRRANPERSAVFNGLSWRWFEAGSG